MTDILIGRDDSACAHPDPHYGNRHGMIGQQIVRGVPDSSFGGKR